MNNTGRKASFAIVSVSFAALLMYDFAKSGRINLVYLGAAVVYSGIGWWLGKQYDKVKHDSIKDKLTGCYNRRFIIDIFAKLKGMADRKSEKLYVLIIDVDDFKTVNDRFGHQAGDRILQAVSSLLMKSFRKSDYIARWGGDEFLAVLVGMNESGQVGMKQRLQAELDALSEQVATEISISVGCSVYPDEGEHLTDLIASADKKMYLQKSNPIKSKGALSEWPE